MLTSINSTTQSVLCLLIFLSSAMQLAAADKVPSDTCVLEINTSPKATVTINGKNYGKQRKFSYSPLKPRVRYRVNLQVEFPGTTSEPKYAYIVGGHRIVLAVMPESDKQPEVVLQTGHQGDITSMAVSKDGRLIATGGSDHNVILWNAATGGQIRTLHRLKGEVKAVAISPDGALVAGVEYGQVVIWETHTGKHVQTIEYLSEYEIRTRSCTSVKWDRASRHVVIGGEIQYVPIGGKIDFKRKPTEEPGFVALWNVNTGKVIREYRGGKEKVTVVDISPDGQSIAAGTDNGSTYVWNIKRSTLLQSVRNHRKKLTAIDFSPDSSTLATTGEDARVVVWDRATKQVDLLEETPSIARSIEWHIDGNELLVGAGRHVLKIDVQNKSTKKFEHRVRGGNSFAHYMPGNEAICVAGERMVIYDDSFESENTSFVHHPSLPINHFVSSQSQARMVANYGETMVLTWDNRTGQPSGRVITPGEVLAISPNGKLIAFEAGNENIGIWDVDSNQQTLQIPAKPDSWNPPVFGPRGEILATELQDGVVKTWSIVTGKLLATLRHSDDYVDMAISPNGRVIAVSADSKVLIRDPRTGRQIREIQVKKGFLRNDGSSVDVPMQAGRLTFHPNGSRILVTSSTGCGVMEYDINTGRRLWENVHSLCRAAYSPEGDVLLGGMYNGGLFMRYSKTVAHQGQYTHDQTVTGVAVDPIANLDISASKDGTIGLWETATGNRVAKIILLNEGKDWAVVGANGLFDGSPGGRKLVRYRLGDQLQVVPADRFFQDFYYPGLMAAYFRGERPIPAQTLGDRLSPLVKIVEPKESTSEMTVSEPRVQIKALVSDRGGGIKPPWIVHNGARLLAPAAGSKTGKTQEQTFTVSLVEGANTIEVHSASDDGSWESEPARLTVHYRHKVEDAQLIAICVGVSQYAEASMNLQFAAKDAQAFGDLFRTQGSKLYGKDKVHIAELTDTRGTRRYITKAFEQATKRARPQDTLVVFLAGHGAMVGQRYYFIPHDFKATNDKLEEDIRQQGIPGDVFDELVNSVPALKRVVVYDTCQSGGALALGYRTRNAFAFRGALERMARATGSFTIAATSANEDAKEIDDLGHGVLTYALLAGAGVVDAGPLKTQRLKTDGKVVDVRDWFNYAQDKVPLVTKTFLGQEQFVSSSGQGSSFPVLPARE